MIDILIYFPHGEAKRLGLRLLEFTGSFGHVTFLRILLFARAGARQI
jgi:hypothetical protein